MNIPNNISSIISNIDTSEDRWKALYMATWGFSYYIKAQFDGTENWQREFPLGLPASKNKSYKYTPEKLYSILTSRDGEFTIGHLQTLFSLFEDLLNESSKILCSEELYTSKWQYMKEFFNQNQDILTATQIKELHLAKETRNCFIHNNSKIDEKWILAYTNSRGTPNANIGDDLNSGFANSFHQIEEWHELILEITDKIKNKIWNKS